MNAPLQLHRYTALPRPLFDPQPQSAPQPAFVENELRFRSTVTTPYPMAKATMIATSKY